MSRAKSVSRRAVAAVNMAIVATLGAAAARGQTQNSTWTNGGGDSSWNNAANWTPGGVPSNNNNGFTDYNVFVGAPSPTNLSGGFTIDSLTIGSLGAINIAGGSALTLDGPTLTNNGTLTVNSNNAVAGTALVLNNVAVSGTGTIALGLSINTGAEIYGTLTQASTHTIAGFGQIGASFINNGTVNANVAGETLTLEGNAMTNNNLFEATAGGTLAISGITVSGGTLNSSTGGVILGINNGTVNNLVNAGTFNIPGGQSFNVLGTLADNGTITVNNDHIAAGTALTFLGATLSGSGTLNLNDELNTAAEIYGTLTQSATHTIAGFGQINAIFTNNGTVNANVSGQTIAFQFNNTTNNHLLEASNGGALAINGANVTGGMLATSTGGAIVGVNGGTITNVTNSGVLNILGGNNFNVGGTLTDNGTITVNSNQVVSATSLTFLGGTVSGTGTINLNDSIDSAADLDGALTQAVGHTIAGFGRVLATITNNGTLNANVSNTTLALLNNTVTNNGLLKATNGGALLINGATVSGGTLNTASGGAIQGTGSGTLSDAVNKGELDILGGAAFSIGGTLTNNGTISVNSNQAVAATSLTFLGGTLAGTGSLNLNDSITTAADLDGTLTQAAGHTIGGFGRILAAMTNNGTLNANVSNSTLTLLNNTVTNNGLLEATNGGALQINGATVTGGTLNTASGGAIQGAGSGTLSSALNNGELDILGGAAFSIGGTLTNNGTITVNSNQAVAATSLTFLGGALAGTGTLDLNDSINTAADLDGTLTQAATHTIGGYGRILAAITNNGTINANTTGQALNLYTNLTNNNFLEATNGGVLNINNVTITQSSGGALLATGNISGTASTVNVIGSIISGGAVTVSSGAVMQFSGNFDTYSGSLKNNGTVSVQGGSSSSPVLLGNITGSGAIVIGNSGYLRLSGVAALSTAGSVTINSGGLDVTNAGLRMNFGAPANDPVTVIAGYLANGYNGGAWTGNGISSSTAAAGGTGVALSVGYADGNNDSGTAAQPNQVLIKYTLAGDANLDGLVNFNDLVAVVQNFNKSGADWAHGNFQYSASTNFNDLVAVVQNFNKTLIPAGNSGDGLGGSTIPLGAPSVQSTDVQLPEPGAVALALLAAAGSFCVRRRRDDRTRI